MKRPHKMCLTCWILFLLLVLAHALRGWIHIDGSRVLGEETYISCGYIASPGQQVRFLYIWPPSFTKDSKFYFMIAKEKDIYLGSRHHDRLSVTVNSSRDSGTTNIVTTATMKIENLQCSDEHIYGCSVEYTSPGRLTTDTYVITKSLIVRGRPSPPDIIVQTILNRQSVNGRSYIAAKCKVNVGRPGLGTIHWRLIRGDNIEVISQGDIRVRNVTVESKNCTLYVEQTLTVEIKTGYESLRFACFVDNSDFPIDNVTQHCRSHSSELCGMTQEVSLIPDDHDLATSILIAAIVLVAGFVLGVILDLLYHYFCKQATPPKKAQPKRMKKKASHKEPESKNEELGEDESIFDTGSEGSSGTQV